MSILIVVSGLIIAGAASIPILLGFGSAGVIGGSAAAGVQSWIGVVSSGSLFAIVQSLAMKGIFLGSTLLGGAVAMLGVGFQIVGNMLF